MLCAGCLCGIFEGGRYFPHQLYHVSICIVLNMNVICMLNVKFFSMSTPNPSIFPKEIKEEMDLNMRSVFGVISLLLMLLLKCLYSSVKKAWGPKLR
jgi:hypothetical protein